MDGWMDGWMMDGTFCSSPLADCSRREPVGQLPVPSTPDSTRPELKRHHTGGGLGSSGIPAEWALVLKSLQDLCAGRTDERPERIRLTGRTRRKPGVELEHIFIYSREGFAACKCFAALPCFVLRSRNQTGEGSVLHASAASCSTFALRNIRGKHLPNISSRSVTGRHNYHTCKACCKVNKAFEIFAFVRLFPSEVKH